MLVKNTKFFRLSPIKPNYFTSICTQNYERPYFYWKERYIVHGIADKMGTEESSIIKDDTKQTKVERYSTNKIVNKDMSQNLGKLDRILRFALAFWWLGPWAPHYGAEWINLVIAIIGWIALVESFIGWCGLHKLFGIDNKNQ